MTSLNFLRSVGIALLLSIGASITYLSMTTLVGSGLAIRLSISVVSFGYILYLLSKANTSFGKLSFISLYGVSTVSLLMLWPNTIDHALYHVGFIWLVRTVYYHSNFFYALIDLAFSVVSFTAALGAIMQSHSVFMSFWCFFLAQALILPVLHYLFNKYSKTHHETYDQHAKPDQRFYQAHRSAQNALRKLTVSH